jgi:hypothetical protein
VHYQLLAFAGAAADVDCVVLQQRTGKYVIVTQTEGHPRPQVMAAHLMVLLSLSLALYLSSICPSIYLAI